MIAQVILLAALLTMTQAGLLEGPPESPPDWDHAKSFVERHDIAIGEPHKDSHEPWAPPKYEFKYGVEDLHTGDWKQQDEKRDHDFTYSNYLVAEKDRKISVNRIISGAVPIPVAKW